MNTVEIPKSPSLKGTPPLQGDYLLSCHGLFLAAIANGSSTLKNVPPSPWFDDLLNIFIRLGFSCSRENSTVTITGGGKPTKLLQDPVRPSHEVILMALGGLFAGMKIPNRLEIDFQHIPRSSLEIFQKLFECESVPATDNTEETVVIKVLNIRSNASTDLRQDYLGKISMLYFHAVSRTEANMQFKDSGPDDLERLLTCFGPAVEFQKSGQAPMSELEKRMARKLKRQDKPEAVIILPELLELKGQSLHIPNDVSLSSVYALAATLIPGSEIILENVLLNHSRNGFFNALRRMGAHIEILQKREICCETTGNIKVCHAELKGRKFDIISLKGMRDEIPLLLIAGSYAQGETVIRDISFMREYTQDLLKKIINALKQANVEIGEIEDGLVIRGQPEYNESGFSSFNNALIGFAFYVFSMKSFGTSTLADTECMTTLFPNAIENLRKLAGS